MFDALYTVKVMTVAQLMTGALLIAFAALYIVNQLKKGKPR